ncbi:MAG: alkene reductase [Bacteroidota bacterium]
MKLFSQYTLGKLELENRVVMAPLTRSRAINNIPNALMAEYYGQRSSGGLLITEGTAPSANGLGYARIPGVYSEAQIEGWKLVTEAVHAKGSKIFLQIMHTGRVSHPLNMEEGTEVLAPSAVALEGEMYTDQEGPQAYPVPKEMSLDEIARERDTYIQAAKNAIAAGFDGVEIHGANGYLVDQFLNTATNKRTDEYGGSIENRSRFALEVAKGVVEAIGAERTGIRLSPYGVFNGMEIYEGIEDTYEYLATELGKLGLVYIHLVDHSPMGAPEVPRSVKGKIREAFSGSLILSGGYDRERADADLDADHADLIAFGRPFLSSPDLVYRLKNGIAPNDPDMNTFYTPGEKGYTDYPFAEENVSA